nr:immunoglobulin heavy chain junction region [Macaca mulatta]
CARYQSGYDFW